jgi:GTP-binding protein HflX
LNGSGLPELLQAVETELYENYSEISVQIPYTDGQLISLFHEQGQVVRIEHSRKGVFIQGLIPGRLMARFNPYQSSAPAFDDTEDDLLEENE